MSKIDIEYAVSRLNDRERTVIKGIYLERMTPAEMAREYGCTVSLVRQIRDKALRHIRRILVHDEFVALNRAAI